MEQWLEDGRQIAAQRQYTQINQERFAAAYAQSKGLIKDDSWETLVAVASKIYGLQDGWIAQTDLSGVDCKRGCAHCCNDTIIVTLAEALAMHYFYTKNFDSDTQAFVLEQAKNRHELTKSANENSKNLSTFYPCPFLGEDNACSIYAARPFMCRAFHSKDVRQCRRFLGNRFSISKDATLPAALKTFEIAANAMEDALKSEGIPIMNLTIEGGILLTNLIKEQGFTSLSEWQQKRGETP